VNDGSSRRRRSISPNSAAEYLARNWKFESTPLQQGVRNEPCGCQKALLRQGLRNRSSVRRAQIRLGNDDALVSVNVKLSADEITSLEEPHVPHAVVGFA
jgi:hypothetical protein